MSRSVLTRPRVVAAGVLLSLAAATPATSVATVAEREGATVVLVGRVDLGLEAAAWRLVDGGIDDVDVGPDAVRPGTELVLVTVSALDGPMPATREALEMLDLAAVPRLAVVLTNTEQQDPELLELVELETTELLAEAGVETSAVPVLIADDPTFAARVEALLLDEPPGSVPVVTGTVVLVGHRDHGAENAAELLTAGGITDVTVGVGSVGPATELVLLTVSALDGPMPGTREALMALDGSTVPRMAILLTNTDELDEPEILQLVILETTDLLARFGIAGPSVLVLEADDPDVVAQVSAILDGPAAGHDVTTPTTAVPPPTEPSTSIPLMRGVPYLDAISLLEEQGLAAAAVVDPTAGVVSDCYPLVLDQFPEPGLVVPLGTVVVLSVPAPDPLVTGDECRLREFADEAAFDAYIAEILAQPGL